VSEFLGDELAEILHIQPGGGLANKTNEDLEVEFKLEQANVKHGAIRQAMGTMLYDARDCGRLLLEAKRLCRHGNWGCYLAECFEGSAREAQRYMQIARDWAALEPAVVGDGKNDTVSHLTIRGALALLAEPKEAPQLPPAPEGEVLEGEVIEAEPPSPQGMEPSPPSPLSQGGEGGQEPEGKRLDNPEAHNEHYTPDHILEAVYACFGGRPYLDPCSNEGEPNVKATRHFTRADNGLEQEWMGQVFVNPPYNPAGELGRWTEKLLKEWHSGRISQALYLVPAYTDTAWWSYMAPFPVLLIRGRLTFKGNTDTARFPSAIFYLGRNEPAFGEAFAHLGDFWTRTQFED